MREDWRKHLADAGGEFDGEQLRDYGNAERERRVAVNGNVICDLSHRAVLVVRGTDAASFLQGQFGNDIREVSATRSQISSYSSPKGRAYAVFRIRLEDDAYWLDIEPGQSEMLRKRLAMFILRAQVTIEPAAETRVRFGLSGPNATELIRELVPDAPQTIHGVYRHSGVTVVRVPGMTHDRYEFSGDFDSCRQLWEDLSVRAAPVGPEGWRLLDILAALPVIYPITSEAFVPQMINLDALGAISFNKGCYPGQEVVARMHYLGKLKRRMYRLAIEGQERPLPGSPVFCEDGDPEQADGQIVDATLHPDGLYAALAVMQTKSIDAPLVWGSLDGPRAHVIPLPYELPGVTL